RHNDRAFGAERPTGPNRNCRRNGFQDRKFRLDAAAVEQNGFNGFRYAMAANSFRTVSRHQPDNETAKHRNGYNKDSKMVPARRNEFCRYPLIKEDICEKSDELQQPQRYECTECADRNGEGGNSQQPRRSCEITQFVRMFFWRDDVLHKYC